ncbi:MAG: PfkB family carbohydrate kinase, partial [Notoacmeibacter sp.]
GLKWLILQNEILQEVNLAVANKASKAGAKIMLNAAPARDLDPEFLTLVDILIVNMVEAAAIKDVALNPLCTTIETRGGDGLHLWNSKGDQEFIPAFKVDVVSSHGAGDCFVGALAARLCAGDELKQAATYASAAAALHVSSNANARAAITQNDVFKLMETRHVDGH